MKPTWALAKYWETLYHLNHGSCWPIRKKCSVHIIIRVRVHSIMAIYAYILGHSLNGAMCVRARYLPSAWLELVGWEINLQKTEEWTGKKNDPPRKKIQFLALQHYFQSRQSDVMISKNEKKETCCLYTAFLLLRNWLLMRLKLWLSLLLPLLKDSPGKIVGATLEKLGWHVNRGHKLTHRATETILPPLDLSATIWSP